MKQSNPITFKFRWMDDGNVTGYIGLSGLFDGNKLVLDDQEFFIETILSVDRDDSVLRLVYEKDDDVQSIEFVVSGESAARVKAAIDTGRSQYDVAREQKQLIEEGQGDSFRFQNCPHCGASISLSRFADTPQCYCTYCDTLFMIDDPAHASSRNSATLSREQESKHRICEQCGMYSWPRTFTIFYFIFLFYFIHFDSRKTERCSGCMRWEAWKMFFGSMFGLLGLPFACMQLWRSYRSRVESGPLKGLDDANSLARRGKVERALDRYDQLMDNLPIHAGIKFNIGSGLLTKGDVPHAETMFLLSLEDCSNYPPSLNGLQYCYSALGKAEELKQLQYQMGIDEFQDWEQVAYELEQET